MLTQITNPDGSLDLQKTIVETIHAHTPGTYLPPVDPHPPIRCTGELRYEEDGSLTCPHAIAAPGDLRTVMALQASIAMLIIEEASRL